MNVKTRNKFIFLSFILLTFCFYYKTQKAGFVTDFLGWQLRYEAGTFADVWHCFDFPALHQVLHLVNYPFYGLFETGGFPYFLFYAVLHSGNAFLLFLTFQHVFLIFKIRNALEVSLAAALFFLLSPYQTEVLVWKVCLHYLMATALCLWSLKMAVQYLENRSEKQYLIAAHLAFFIALFTLEISLMLPFITLTYLLFWTFSFDKKKQFWSNFARLSVPQFGGLIAYFGLNRYFFGAIVGHYGADTHLQFPLAQMSANFFKYFTKHFGFVRYVKHQTKTDIFAFFDQPLLLWTLVAACFILLMLAILFFKKLSPRLRLMGMSLLLAAFALAPVLNLFFAFLLKVENDRYGYFASVFIAVFTALLFQGLPKWGSRVFMIAYLAISAFFLQKTTTYWAESSQIYNALLEDFRWEDAPKVYILNMPDNYYGVYLFRDYESNNSLSVPLKLLKSKTTQGEIFEVAQYNPPTPEAGVSVQWKDAQTLIVKFKQYGNWWWRDGVGARDYETDDFKVSFSGVQYRLVLKKEMKEVIFIYQDGLEWKTTTFQ